MGRSAARGVVAQAGLRQRPLHEARERDAPPGGGLDLVAQGRDEALAPLARVTELGAVAADASRSAAATAARLS